MAALAERTDVRAIMSNEVGQGSSTYFRSSGLQHLKLVSAWLMELSPSAQ